MPLPKYCLRTSILLGKPIPNRCIKQSIQFGLQILPRCRVSLNGGFTAHWPNAMALLQKNALIASGENAILFTHNVPLNHPFIEGVIARMIKDNEKARSAFSAARAEQEKIVQAQPNYGPALCVLGLIDAGLGRKDDALREGRRAVELLPVEKDAMEGPAMIKYLAMIAAWVGDKDLACEQLAVVIRRPNGPSYGELKLLPLWDPLRGDPRFEKLVEESKQPVGLK